MLPVSVAGAVHVSVALSLSSLLLWVTADCQLREGRGRESGGGFRYHLGHVIAERYGTLTVSRCILVQAEQCYEHIQNIIYTPYWEQNNREADNEGTAALSCTISTEQ